MKLRTRLFIGLTVISIAFGITGFLVTGTQRRYQTSQVDRQLQSSIRAAMGMMGDRPGPRPNDGDNDPRWVYAKRPVVSVGGEPLYWRDVLAFDRTFPATSVLQNAMASTETRTKGLPRRAASCMANCVLPVPRSPYNQRLSPVSSASSASDR